MSNDFTRHAGPGAIVLGGNFVALGVVRSLAAHGIRVWVIDFNRNTSIARFSRYAERFIEAQGSLTELLLSEGRDHHLEGWVLIPVGDQYVETLATDRDALSTIYRVTTPRLPIVNFALDKRLTYLKAAELGIATPWTVAGKSLGELLLLELPYPIVLKPAVNHHFFPQTNVKALLIESSTDLASGYERMAKHIPAHEIMVQERVPGGGESQFSYCAACNNGQVYADLVAQRRRQYPIEFGNASSFVETTSLPVVEAAGRRFLESIGFDGIAEVEFKFDCRDGKYKLLDFNSRTWGWQTIGKAAGIDFAYLLWQQATGMPTVKIESTRDASWLREITDPLAILKSPNRALEIKELAKAIMRGNLTLATFSWHDPVPFFAEFFLFLSSGRSRQTKAREFLASTPVAAGSQNKTDRF